MTIILQGRRQMTTTTITAASPTSCFRTDQKLIASDENSVFELEPEYEESTHVPYRNLTKEERDKKSGDFEFGLCCDCDAGLADKSEFICPPRPNGAFVNMCNACHNYYTNLFQTRVGGEESGGCS